MAKSDLESAKAMGVEISKKLVAFNAGSALVAKAINIGVLIWLQQYLLRKISPEEYALYPLLMAIIICVPLLTTILTSGLGRYIVEAYARGDEWQVTRIVSTMLPPLAAAGLVVLAGGWALAWNIDHVLKIDPPQVSDARFMLALLIFSAAMSVPAAALSVGLYVRQKFVLQNAITLSAELFRLALLFALLFGISTRVRWVVVASVVANLMTMLAMVLISRRLIPVLRFRRDAIHWPLLSKLTSFGTWNFIGQVAHTLRSAADPLILNRWGTATDVTCFHLGNLPNKHIRQGVALAMAPLQPPMIAMHATGDRSRLGRTYIRSSRYGMWMAIAIAMPLVIFSRELMVLYVAREFLAAATVMALTMGLFPITYTSLMLPSLAIAKAQLRRMTIYGLITHVANISLTLYLVRGLSMGAIGVAVAYFITGVACQPLFMPLGLRLAEVTCRQWLYETVWLGISPGLAASGMWLALRFIVQPSTWLSLGVCAAAGMTVYIAALFCFCLNRTERTDLSLVWRQLRSRLSGSTRAAAG